MLTAVTFLLQLLYLHHTARRETKKTLADHSDSLNSIIVNSSCEAFSFNTLFSQFPFLCTGT